MITETQILVLRQKLNTQNIPLEGRIILLPNFERKPEAKAVYAGFAFIYADLDPSEPYLFVLQPKIELRSKPTIEELEVQLSELQARFEIGESAFNASDFRKQLESLLSYHHKENGSDTPNFALAEFLINSLSAFDKAVKLRSKFQEK